MAKLRLFYPELLTNAAWQSKKKLTLGATGIGKQLLKLEHAFKASPFDRGLDTDDLVVADPVQTLDTLKKLSKELKRLSTPLNTAITDTYEQIEKVQQESKLKTKDPKAFQHTQEMKKALDDLKEEISGFFGLACSSAHEAYLEAVKAHRPSNTLMEVGEEAETLLKLLGKDRAQVGMAKTMKELRLALLQHRLGEGLCELTQLWDGCLKGHKALLKALDSPIGSDGAAYGRIEKLTVLSARTYQNDVLLRVELEQLLLEHQKRHPNAQEQDVVLHLAKTVVEAMNEAEKVLEAIVAVRDEAEAVGRRIAKLAIKQAEKDH